MSNLGGFNTLRFGSCLLLIAAAWLPAAFGQRGVYKATVRPHWSAEETHFWYRNELPDERREYVLVDVIRGERQPAFDHQRLATALRASGVDDCDPERLDLRDLEFDLVANTLIFRAENDDWQVQLDTYELHRIEQRQPLAQVGLTPLPTDDAPRASRRTGEETELLFVNETPESVELFWLDAAGRRRSYGSVSPKGRHRQHTYAGHVWEVLDPEGRTLAIFEAEESSDTAVITGEHNDQRQVANRPGSRPRRGTSPDGKWRAFVRDHNVFLRDTVSDEESQLTEDGEADNSYDLLEWSPDSRKLVAFRVEAGDVGEVYLIESSPPGGGRARLRTRSYALPGDKFPLYELNLFEAATKRQLKPDVERIDFGRPRIRWIAEGERFTYEKTDRGHQRFRVIEIDAETGSSRHIIDEQSETFIWTQHGDFGALTRYLEQTNEIIYASEQDGWRHLYLVDGESGEMTQITQGQWVVRGIQRIDEDNRQVWFEASGLHPHQDPYLIHYCRVNFDGTDLTMLTSGDGGHSVRYSPARQYLIDTYSRVDMPPVHELRRVSDGTLVCEFERADISELLESGWESPEVFSAKGRDGQTDIWGLIYRPRDFDPDKQYPVIEAIYAGPHDSYVPKTFSVSQPYRSLTNLGFVVAKIDGMGTANRSKAFHDVCWQNLKDAGLPDRILWHKAVAEKYPWYDISRVGIFGGSAGGQNAAGAVLFHPDFYKVAVASCGCHDNRMDKASWNEQWMGYPVGPHYSESSNIEHAHRLRGNLLLIVGELDTNVPPESTLRLADALIKAEKDFELLVIPGGGHGDGGRYGERRRQDFFVKHLLGEDPPDRNAR